MVILSLFLVTISNCQETNITPFVTIGWNYSVEALEPLDTELRRVLKVPEMIRTPQERVIRDLHQRGWHGVACTHTCLPMCQDFIDPETGNSHVVINNGSAGMGNFRQSPAGLLTRISSTSHRNALYGLHSRGVVRSFIPFLTVTVLRSLANRLRCTGILYIL